MKTRENFFEANATRLRARILRIAGRFLSATSLRYDPEDVAQEVLLRLHLELRDGKEIENPDAWVGRVARNLCVSLYRKSRTLPIEPLSRNDESEGEPDSPAPSEGLIQRAMERIPPGTRLLLGMKDEGMSLDEISLATGRPKASVKSSISQARRTIVELLQKEELL